MADNSIAGATAEARRIFSLVSVNLNQREPCKYDNFARFGIICAIY